MSKRCLNCDTLYEEQDHCPRCNSTAFSITKESLKESENNYEYNDQQKKSTCEGTTNTSENSQTTGSSSTLGCILALACIIAAIIGLIQACGALLDDSDGVCDNAGCKNAAITTVRDIEFCLEHYIELSYRAHND